VTYLQDAFDRLNDPQKEAVRHDGHTVVLAGPGSGKTATLALKVGHLLADRIAAPQGVACVTYNNDAVREFTSRLAQLGLRPGRRLYTGTVHSFCLNRVLRPFGRLRPDVARPGRRVIAGRERMGLLQAALEQEGSNTEARWFDITLKTIRSARAMGEELRGFDEEQLRVAGRFESILIDNGLVDFDGMVLDALRLITAAPVVSEVLSARFPWLAVDEYQDLGGPLHGIVKRLQTAGTKIFAVGDADQTLYAFTGADPRYLQALVDDPDFRCVTLRFNYRAGARLISASQATLALDEDRNYEADPTRTDEGVVTPILVEGGLAAQARLLAETVIPQLRDEEGIPYHQIAALYPIQNHILTPLLDALVEAEIPHMIERDEQFPDAPVVKWLQRCAYRALQHTGPDVERFGALLSRYRDYARDARLLDHAFELEMRARLYRVTAHTDDVEQPLESWLAAALDELDLRMMLTRGDVYPDDVEALTDLQLVAEAPDVTLGQFADKVKAHGRVIVTTYHASKGREFDAVVLMGLQDQLIPRHQWDGKRWYLTDAKLKEQRRLFYVAITRARKQVVLLSSPTWTNKNGYVQREGPSRFVSEISERLGL
jgi:DNA helicase II / ATP-dependent DNA helicase PcrA